MNNAHLVRLGVMDSPYHASPEHGLRADCIQFAGISSAGSGDREKIPVLPSPPLDARPSGRRRRSIRSEAGAGRGAMARSRQTKSPMEKGSRRGWRPVALNTALATAGPIGGTPGSPTPVGASMDGTICTSTVGMSERRSGS